MLLTERDHRIKPCGSPIITLEKQALNLEIFMHAVKVKENMLRSQLIN
jgi:hypothetical protein